jgi:hypothetical protein
LLSHTHGGQIPLLYDRYDVKGMPSIVCAALAHIIRNHSLKTNQGNV